MDPLACGVNTTSHLRRRPSTSMWSRLVIAQPGNVTSSRLASGLTQLRTTLLRFRFQQLLLELRRQEGWTVLHVSHDLDMVRRSSDQVLGLNRRLCCSGSPEHPLTPERLIDL